MCLYVQIAGQTGWTGLANDHILMIKHGYISNTLCLSGLHGYIHEKALASLLSNDDKIGTAIW